MAPSSQEWGPPGNPERFTYYVDAAGDRVFETAGGGLDTVRTSVSYTLAAGQEIENLYAQGNAAISLTGNGFDNTLIGNDGANTLDGGYGIDTMRGGAGADTYYVSSYADIVIESEGGGEDLVRAFANYALGAGQRIEKLIASEANGTVALNLTGNEYTNTIVGNDGANTLDGGAGQDDLFGGGGNDTFLVDNTQNTVHEAVGEGIDTVIAGASFTLAGGQEVERLRTANEQGTAAIDLTGNDKVQTLTGNAGANTLDGGGGADTMTGLAGDDRYVVDELGDQVIEAANGGTDTVLARATYVLAAGQEIETLATVNAAATTAINLTGNEKTQNLHGNAGANVLDGKEGYDVLYGYAGADTFAFSTAIDASNIDRISDFSSVDDTIRLSKSVFTALDLGTLRQGAFKDLSVGSVDADDRILYDPIKGRLAYDADGSGAGVSVQFAILSNKPTLAYDDFLLA